MYQYVWLAATPPRDDGYRFSNAILCLGKEEEDFRRKMLLVLNEWVAATVQLHFGKGTPENDEKFYAFVQVRAWMRAWMRALCVRASRLFFAIEIWFQFEIWAFFFIFLSSGGRALVRVQSGGFIHFNLPLHFVLRRQAPLTLWATYLETQTQHKHEPNPTQHNKLAGGLAAGGTFRKGGAWDRSAGATPPPGGGWRRGSGRDSRWNILPLNMWCFHNQRGESDAHWLHAQIRLTNQNTILIFLTYQNAPLKS